MTGPRNPCAGSGALCCPAPVADADDAPGRTGVCRGGRHTPTPYASASASACFAAASIAASDFLTWLRSVVYQKSGSEAFR